MPGPNARIDEAVREAFEIEDPNARLDVAVREAFVTANPNVRLDLVVRESWISLVPAGASGQVFLGARPQWRNTISSGWQKTFQGGSF